MIALQNILKGVQYNVLQGNVNISINNLQYDSRKVNKDDLFICIKGFQSDGHKFVDMAIEKGATVIIAEDDIKVSNETTVIKVSDTRKTLADISSAFYDYPWKKLDLIGITGTNGKTTTTYLIQSILNSYNKKVGVIGTIENRIGDKVIKAERTTPESKELQELFCNMVEEQVSHCVMEVSSHALDLHRVGAMDFDVAVFTNLSQDHLDYHETMEKYKEAKSILFKNATKSVINIDDEAGEYMLKNCKGSTISYGIEKNCDLKATNIKFSALGSKFCINYKNEIFDVEIATPGKFSVYNALGAIGACIFLGISIDTIIEGLKNNKGVAGRFQSVVSDSGVQIVVDYAHTPDGLENILKTAREFVKGDIITVFGCGGDRDKTKRPIMGEVAGKYSDIAIITSDNPRTEDPIAITKDVEVGMILTNTNYEIIIDRKEAIKNAIERAKENDLVIIAGKGHENYQIFKDETIHFDDMEEVMKLL